MDAYADSKTALVADVDCTASGKPLCDSNGVQGFPTIKWGDPSALEDYQGGRDFDALKKHADENLKPMCSPTNIDLCDDFKKFVEGLQKQYEEGMKKKDDAIAAVKASGLGLMKAVKAAAAKGKDEL